MSPDELLAFWFEEIPEAAWWRKDPEFDALLRRRFGAVHEAAAAGELWGWRATLPGRLAEIVALDQLPRNLFRGTPRAFATDGMALVLAQEALAGGAEAGIERRRLAFVLLPFMHSESLAVQERGLALHRANGFDERLIGFAEAHARIVRRFGRFPHRNAILGRTSTAEELAFLQEEGSSF